MAVTNEDGISKPAALPEYKWNEDVGAMQYIPAYSENNLPPYWQANTGSNTQGGGETNTQYQAQDTYPGANSFYAPSDGLPQYPKVNAPTVSDKSSDRNRYFDYNTRANNGPVTSDKSSDPFSYYNDGYGRNTWGMGADLSVYPNYPYMRNLYDPNTGAVQTQSQQQANTPRYRDDMSYYNQLPYGNQPARDEMAYYNQLPFGNRQQTAATVNNGGSGFTNNRVNAPQANYNPPRYGGGSGGYSGGGYAPRSGGGSGGADTGGGDPKWYAGLMNWRF